MKKNELAERYEPLATSLLKMTMQEREAILACMNKTAREKVSEIMEDKWAGQVAEWDSSVKNVYLKKLKRDDAKRYSAFLVKVAAHEAVINGVNV